MKSIRQNRIIEIITTGNIETQQELTERLKDYNIDATQATISRDIKELKLQKNLTDEGTYKYTLPGHAFDQELDVRLRNIFREGVVSIDYAKNIVVLRTLPGLASAACSAVDAMHFDYIVGSLGGDDTGIIILRDDEHAQAFCAKLQAL